MTNDPASQRVAQFAPRINEFEQRIRRIAAETENVKWSKHARERMRERDISIRTALQVIREGYVVGQIEPGENLGEWKAKVVKNAKGTRDVGVIVLTIKNEALLVKTVEWEDIR